VRANWVGMIPLRRATSGRLYYGWVVLAAVAGMNFANGATAIAVLTVFVVPLSTDFGWTRTQISAVTSVGAVIGALIAPFAGRLVDRHGARLPLALGGGCIVLGMLNLATMQSLVWFYLAFGLARLADQGFVQALSPPAMAKWFRRSQGKAMAILTLSNAAGGVVLPLLVHPLAPGSHLWPAQNSSSARLRPGSAHCGDDFRPHSELSRYVCHLPGTQPGQHCVDRPGATAQTRPYGRVSLRLYGHLSALAYWNLPVLESGPRALSAPEGVQK
jgi:hypothetical protein